MLNQKPESDPAETVGIATCSKCLTRAPLSDMSLARPGAQRRGHDDCLYGQLVIALLPLPVPARSVGFLLATSCGVLGQRQYLPSSPWQNWADA